MKKIIALTVIALLCFTQSFAQVVPFETLDSFSTLISQLQKQTDGKSYKDLNGKVYELSFPKENFKVWSYNRLATKAVYKKEGNKEILTLTENIDFSKATGISVAEDYKGIVYIKVDFPKDYLKTQNIENGSVTNTVKESYIQFFCQYGVLVDTADEFLFDKMFDLLYQLAAQLKIEKGLMKEEDMINELADWDDMEMNLFAEKHPNSILAVQARLNAKGAVVY